MKVILSFLLEEGDRTLAMSNEHFGCKRSVQAINNEQLRVYFS